MRKTKAFIVVDFIVVDFIVGVLNFGGFITFCLLEFFSVGSFFDSLKVLGLECVNGLLQDRDPSA